MARKTQNDLVHCIMCEKDVPLTSVHQLTYGPVAGKHVCMHRCLSRYLVDTEELNGEERNSSSPAYAVA